MRVKKQRPSLLCLAELLSPPGDVGYFVEFPSLVWHAVFFVLEEVH